MYFSNSAVGWLWSARAYASSDLSTRQNFVLALWTKTCPCFLSGIDNLWCGSVQVMICISKVDLFEDIFPDKQLQVLLLEARKCMRGPLSCVM